MAISAVFTKRIAFCMVAIIAALLIFLTLKGGYHKKLNLTIKSKFTSECVTARPPQKAIRDVKTYNFPNGIITVRNSSFSLSNSDFRNMASAEMENLYEKVVLETTADCSTSQRFGLTVDGGWDLCLVGPFKPEQPCFSFSFGINNVWGFDDEIANTFNCQVLTFDPTMSLNSHMRSQRVAFFKEGLHAKAGVINGWTVNTFLGFLKRFGAEYYVIDILKMDIDYSEWPALDTIVRDGSLRNVKQLMLEMHIQKKDTVEGFRHYFSIIKSLYDLGFRQWHHNWNIHGTYHSELNKGVTRTCCHELYYINIHFLPGGRQGLQVRNPANSKIVFPFAGAKTNRTK